MVTGDLLYIGSCAGICYALAKNTGAPVWEYDVGALSFHGDPIFTDSVVIISTDGESGSVYALTLTEGKLAWRYDVSDESGLGVGVTTDLIRHGKAVLGVTTADRLISLDIKTGEMLWDYKISHDHETDYWNVAPVTRDSVVYFAGLNGLLYGLHAQSGEELWKLDLGARPTSSLQLAEKDLYLGTVDNMLYRISTNEGKVIDSLQVEGMPSNRLNMVDSNLYVLIFDDTGSSRVTNLIAVNDNLTDVIWEFPIPTNAQWTCKKPYHYRNWIAIANFDGEVFLLDPLSGEVEITFGVEGVIRSMGFDDDVIYVGTQEGTIHAVRVED